MFETSEIPLLRFVLETVYFKHVFQCGISLPFEGVFHFWKYLGATPKKNCYDNRYLRIADIWEFLKKCWIYSNVTCCLEHFVNWVIIPKVTCKTISSKIASSEWLIFSQNDCFEGQHSFDYISPHHLPWSSYLKYLVWSLYLK